MTVSRISRTIPSGLQSLARRSAPSITIATMLASRSTVPSGEWLRPSSTNFEDTWLPSNGVATLPSIEPMLTIRRPFLAAAAGTPGSSPAGDLLHHEVFTTSSAPGATAYMLFDQRHQPRWAKRASRLLGSGCDCAAPRTSNRRVASRATQTLGILRPTHAGKDGEAGVRRRSTVAYPMPLDAPVTTTPPPGTQP